MKEKHIDQELDELLKRIHQLKKLAIENLKTIPIKLDDNKKENIGTDEQSTL